MSGQLSKSDQELYLQLRNKYTSGAQAVSIRSCLLAYLRPQADQIADHGKVSP